jgi:hypothetical protein
LKANHNYFLIRLLIYGLLPKIQRTKVESKSQLVLTVTNTVLSCYQKYKEQKLKATLYLPPVCAEVPAKADRQLAVDNNS